MKAESVSRPRVTQKGEGVGKETVTTPSHATRLSQNTQYCIRVLIQLLQLKWFGEHPRTVSWLYGNSFIVTNLYTHNAKFISTVNFSYVGRRFWGINRGICRVAIWRDHTGCNEKRERAGYFKSLWEGIPVIEQNIPLDFLQDISLISPYKSWLLLLYKSCLCFRSIHSKIKHEVLALWNCTKGTSFLRPIIQALQ